MHMPRITAVVKRNNSVPDPVQAAAQPITRMPASRILSNAAKRRNIVAPGHVQPVTVSPVIPEPTLPIVDPSVWGASLWLILHVASVLSASDSQKEAFAKVLAALRSGIPCPECSGHFNRWYESHPVQSVTYTSGNQHKLASKVFRIGSVRTSIVSWVPLDLWTLDLHNDVNRRREVELWNADRMITTYGNAPLADVRAASLRLQGIIGANASSAIDSMLNAIGA